MNERSNLFLPVSGLLIIIASLGGLVLFDQPLESRRPTTKSSKIETPHKDGFSARLWEDPFEPLANAEDGVFTELHALSCEIQKRVPKEPINEGDENLPKQLVLLPVVVPGGIYFEQKENRRRTRQAVVSALAVKGFVPLSGEKIQITCANLDGGSLEAKCSKETESRDVAKIPFEWFRRDPLYSSESDGGSRWVLVFWLSDDYFDKYLIAYLDSFLNQLLDDPGCACKLEPQKSKEAKDCDDSPTEGKALSRDELLKRIDFRLIGPSNSSTLSNLLGQPALDKLGSMERSSSTKKSSDQESNGKSNKEKEGVNSNSFIL